MPRRKKSEYRRALEFAAVLAVLGAAFAGLSFWRHHPTKAAVYGAAGVAALVLAAVARPFWVRVFRLWMKLAEAMGWVTTRLVLTIFYYVFLTPLGWARRWSGRPTLDTAWRDGRASYWIEKEPVEISIERYEKRY